MPPKSMPAPLRQLLMEKDPLFAEVEFVFSCSRGRGDFSHPLDQLLPAIASDRICGSYERCAGA